MAFRLGEPGQRARLHGRLLLFPTETGGRRFGTGSGEEFAGRSAYEVLGVSESSSFSEIKASFRKLAKETHPDVSPSPDPAAASRRFLQILAAYEVGSGKILQFLVHGPMPTPFVAAVFTGSLTGNLGLQILSDSQKRAHYDNYLLSQRQILQKQAEVGNSAVYAYRYSSVAAMANQTEVVEWLKWYRLTVDDIISSKRTVSGSGYFGELENELYSAIRAAYYGPVIESMDHLPDCFEAEERSTDETPELLHLVSGRDLLGIVYMGDKVPELSHGRVEKLASSPGSEGSRSCPSVYGTDEVMRSGPSLEGVGVQELHVRHYNSHVPDVYRDLEVHISGRIVATAARVPPKVECGKDLIAADSEDHIHVFLDPSEDKAHMRGETPKVPAASNSVGSKVFLGTIKGLGTSPEEGSCFVYDNSGAKTHVIMKHRTLLVKHMHWYQIGDETSACECRCSRARLPPSRFWLFEPRSCMHDIGGWYIETFGRDKKGRTTPSQRQWDGTMEYHEKRLHPAMYLVALAYRTLDLEDAKQRKKQARDIIGPTVSSIFRWCKKLV
ncbi:hypothetical protein Taro_045681 [Colocasia esculenta]|uniref:J domain-containing protein n=1 Tax=Colocasia esculenta TaxID=4460 RepID=A0A843WQ46_COLES|nr:hypothetical protein [Colocasia esculenta]